MEKDGDKGMLQWELAPLEVDTFTTKKGITWEMKQKQHAFEGNIYKNDKGACK